MKSRQLRINAYVYLFEIINKSGIVKMAGISLLDSAIKSFVEIPKKLHERITYTRTQLLTYRSCRTAQDWPPIFDRRFAKSKTRKLSYFYSGLHRSFENRTTNKTSVLGPQEDKTVAATKGDSENRNKKESKFYDEAIVSAELYSKNFRERNFYDRPNLSSPYSHGWTKYAPCTKHHPEWYVFGPEDVDEGVDQYDYDMSAGDDEKENSTLHKHQNRGTFVCVDEGVKNPTGDSSFTKNRNPVGLIEHSTRGDRPPNIKTLREIESKLRVQQIDPKSPADMSAYYKLLGLVGNSFQSSAEAPRGPDSVSHKSTNNNQPRAAVSTSHFSAALSQLYADPAVSAIVDSKIANFFSGNPPPQATVRAERPSNHPKPQFNERPGVNTTVPCNPITASYQRQVMASGPLGQNALRWFKAMTNAASANACISQQLDVASHNLPSNEHLADLSQLQSQPELIPDSHLREQPISHNTVHDQGNMALDVNLKPPLNVPIHIRPSEQILGSALSSAIAGSFPIRPMKPLLFYYPPHANHLFGRPMMNSLILHQLLQYQMGLRALHMPFNYLRTQPVLPQLGYNPYLSAFNYTVEPKPEALREDTYISESAHDISSTASRPQNNRGEE
ncbi:hypothetical protein CRM22_006648 [Opisthorchis felineus]|uniref:Uncharacterized protein n=1 Tax=Opisthorchis felineus TaxID=147828 RepID=A0A4S2LK44_OPIFE|nr:hypothetical protein CRM22_006648 [Opisthorchis felineus]